MLEGKVSPILGRNFAYFIKLAGVLFNMSQNAHTLLLFFEREENHKDCVLMLTNAARGEAQKANHYAERLGINLLDYWGEGWFNEDFEAQPEWIRLNYETSTTETLPTKVLIPLFENGLAGAVLETFHDQVGETTRHYFLGSELVGADRFYQALPQTRAVVEEQLEELDEVELENSQVEQPVSLKKLDKQEEKLLEEGQEMVEAITNLFEASQETGQEPLQVMKSALVLRAAVKGLLHAILFGVVTVLLFKGFWLWISLTLLLLVVLPLYQVAQVGKDFSADDEESGDEDPEDKEPERAD